MTQARKMVKYEKSFTTACTADPRPDILSPWRQLLSLLIPYHVHWTRSYCRGLAHTADVYRKPCFRDLPCIHDTHRRVHVRAIHQPEWKALVCVLSV